MQEFGKSEYKEVTVNGEKVQKWIKLNSFTQYDSNGNMLHTKNYDGKEAWYEYDSNGNIIHAKNSDGYEEWQEYDSRSNIIHYKKSTGDEYWYEYTFYPDGTIKTKAEYRPI